MLAIVCLVLIDAQAWLAACVTFIVAASTDFIDGYIARRYGLVTVLGRILDPLVDKIVVAGAFTFLAAVPGSGVHPWLVVLVVVRELFITSLRGMLEAAGRDFSAAWSGKIKMAVQCAAIVLVLLSLWGSGPNESGAAWLAPLNVLRDLSLGATAVATLYSAYVYVVRAAAMLRGD